MTRFDIFYNFLTSLLRNIVDSNSTTAYYDLLPGEVQKEKFVSLTDPIRDFVTELKRKKRATEIFGDYEPLSISIEQFYIEFGSYPNLRIEQIRKAILICKRISPFVNKTRLNTTKFILLPVIDKIKPNNYLFYGSSINDSALIFSLKQIGPIEINEFQTFLDDIPDAQIQILFHLLAKLGSRTELIQQQYILVNQIYKNKLFKIVSLLKLCSVCDGDVVHTPYEINRNPQIISKSNLGLQNSYTQFIDSIHILSEYNYETDILNKYLRLYHVVENFMFKIPIVELMATTGGNMFSVRNFKNLYSKVDKYEKVALIDFIKVIFELEKTPGGNKFKTDVKTLWNSLSGLPGYNANEIDDFLRLIKIPFTCATAHTNMLEFYGSLVYMMRNSIVHNKETEYHILHSKLNPTVPFLMLNFLFPSLEEICFKLIIDIDNIVKYSRSNLLLYEE